MAPCQRRDYPILCQYTMQLYSFRSLSDAIFLLVALTLAVSSFLLIASSLVDHLRNYKYPTLQVSFTA